MELAAVAPPRRQRHKSRVFLKVTAVQRVCVLQCLTDSSTCCLDGRRRRFPCGGSHVFSAEILHEKDSQINPSWGIFEGLVFYSWRHHFRSANVEAQCAGVLEDSPRPSTTSQGYVLPEGKIMPNTVFVGGIDIRMNEVEIRSFFERYGTVKEVKIITDRTGVSKGYGFVSFLDNVDVQKIVESQINFHGKKLKLGPAIRKQQNLCSYVHPRPLVFSPPAPQFHSVWSSQNTETYMQPPAVMSPVTQYVQTYPYSSPALLIQQQVPVGYQPAYNYQVQPPWLAGEQRNYVMPPVYTSVSYHCTEDPEFIQTECTVPEPAQSSSSSPQKKSVDRSIQTVVSCLFNPENRLGNTFVSQEDYLKERKPHHFRKGRAVLKSV
ncbi:deleted in azoospermia-like [Apus apus]|uniref:deleted in azoospermia-like n=1 Tax=Apus apus TaxID=8895 RepID=UPI0021F83D15|nr:deleted in azoospermia-like [Apus apus]